MAKECITEKAKANCEICDVLKRDTYNPFCPNKADPVVRVNGMGLFLCLSVCVCRRSRLNVCLCLSVRLVYISVFLRSVYIFLCLSLCVTPCLSACLSFPVLFSVSVYKVSVRMPLVCVGGCVCVALSLSFCLLQVFLVLLYARCLFRQVNLFFFFNLFIYLYHIPKDMSRYM